MKTSQRVAAIVFLALVALPATAWADTGTLLIFATGTHLLVGNFIIGVGEAALLKRFFGPTVKWAWAIMVVANYASAWSALLTIGFANDAFPWITIYNAGVAVVILLTGSFLWTILVEWPFVRATLGWKTTSWQRSLKANLVAQTASYAVILPIYLYASQLTLLEIERNPAVVSAAPVNIIAYYVGPDGAVYRHRLGGGAAELVSQPAMRFESLALEPSADSSQWTLYGCRSSGGVMGVIPVATGPRPRRATWVTAHERGFSICESGSQPKDLRADSSSWIAYGWTWNPLVVRNTETGGRYEVGYEVPFLGAWFIGNVTLLPGDLALYQFGRQVVVLDLAKRRMGLLGRGTRPIVMIENTKF